MNGYLQVKDERERLVVALMQKKVSELLGLERFGAQFQIGMLASFESFLETSDSVAKARAHKDGADAEVTNFDDDEQTADAEHRRGIDVGAINHIARDFRGRFKEELPHPKMNALVRDLASAWQTGQKALVFVRRVRSVVELKRRLDDQYDQWLRARLLSELPARTHDDFVKVFERYQAQKIRARTKGIDDVAGSRDGDGDVDTFFAYFFRGDGPRGVVSGATLQRYFIQDASVYASFFEDNHVAWLLGARPGRVQTALIEALGLPASQVAVRLDNEAQRFLTNATTVTRGKAFEAAQAAAVALLKELATTLGEQARVVWHERYEPVQKSAPRRQRESGLMRWLERATFFSELRERPQLREALWPKSQEHDFPAAFREQEQRAECLSAAARLGHGLIDLYVLAIHELGTLEAGARRARDQELQERDKQRIDVYLDRLESQQRVPMTERGFAAFDELHEIAKNFQLLLDVNLPDIRSTPLTERSRLFAEVMRRQQPTGGMTGGSAGQTLVKQFRMPGYPFVLIATEVLQEGEDLHTFCSRVHHYGISWTPSSMEQRTGRIDRVRSQTDRRLSRLRRDMTNEDRLQVYYPHLGDTVESLQVRRVLRKMDRFLRLMHEGLTTQTDGDRTVHVDRAILDDITYPEPITERLKTAFAIPKSALAGTQRDLGRTAVEAEAARTRFRSLEHSPLGELQVEWVKYTQWGPLLGTARVGSRIQPFALYLGSISQHLSIRCISPVGAVDLDDDHLCEIVDRAANLQAPVAAVLGRKDSAYNLTVEDDVLLGDPTHDQARVTGLVRRVIDAADKLELRFLPGKDEPLSKFERDLAREGGADG